MKVIYTYLAIFFLSFTVSCTQNTDAVSNWKTTVQKLEKDKAQCKEECKEKNNNGLSLEAYTVNNGKLYWIYMPVKYPNATAEFCCEDEDSCKKIVHEELAGTHANFEEVKNEESTKPSYTIYFGSASITP